MGTEMHPNSRPKTADNDGLSAAELTGTDGGAISSSFESLPNIRQVKREDGVA